ncbi:MAG: hypothetical protein Q9228_007749, partial [Teloschistes exilis]
MTQPAPAKIIKTKHVKDKRSNGDSTLDNLTPSKQKASAPASAPVLEQAVRTESMDLDTEMSEESVSRTQDEEPSTLVLVGRGAAPLPPESQRMDFEWSEEMRGDDERKAKEARKKENGAEKRRERAEAKAA